MSTNTLVMPTLFYLDDKLRKQFLESIIFFVRTRMYRTNIDTTLLRVFHSGQLNKTSAYIFLFARRLFIDKSKLYSGRNKM